MNPKPKRSPNASPEPTDGSCSTCTVGITSELKVTINPVAVRAAG